MMSGALGQMMRPYSARQPQIGATRTSSGVGRTMTHGPKGALTK